MTDTLNLVMEFSEIYEKERRKIPYHLNLLDEIKVDENAHSRILYKLFQFQSAKTNQFEILESFIAFIQKKYKDKNEFRNISISSPVITCEELRIDLWVRDKGKYAIILENKVHDASDQDTQLQRYIDRTKLDGFSEKQIFVLYLPSSYAKEPTVESWGNYFESEIHKNRFLILSFKEDILDWFKTKLLPELRIKDKLLITSIEQYIDHLEGKFNLRKEEENMKVELEKFIEASLNSDLNSRNSIEVIDKTLNNINLLIDGLIQLKRKEQIKLMETWYKELKKVFNKPYYEVKKYKSNPNKFNIEVHLKLKNGINLNCSFESVKGEDKPYFGLRKKSEHNINEELINEVFQKLNQDYFLSFHKNATEWYLWQYSNYSNGYLYFIEFIKKISELILKD